MALVHVIEWTVVGEELCVPLTFPQKSSSVPLGSILKISIQVSIRGHGVFMFR